MKSDRENEEEEEEELLGFNNFGLSKVPQFVICWHCIRGEGYIKF